MGKYVVKSGENIFDVAMKLYGGIEGVFDLLVSNQDAITETGVSLHQTLTVGTELTYTDNFVVNQDIAGWLDDNNIKVKNGEHNYLHFDVEKYISSYIKKYNTLVVKNAFSLWPSVSNYDDGGATESDIDAFIKYVNSYCIWVESISVTNISALANGNYSVVTTITIPENFSKPKMVVNQVGLTSSLTYNLKKPSLMVIDWGDNTFPEICKTTSKSIFLEHCYEDVNTHTIRIYGNISFSYLDLRDIGGPYYPLTEIQVAGAFYSKYSSDSTINKLIKQTT